MPENDTCSAAAFGWWSAWWSLEQRLAAWFRACTTQRLAV